MTEKKYWTSKDQEYDLCKKWLQNKLENPETGQIIEYNGPTFKKWKERCKASIDNSKKIKQETITFASCQQWKKNPLINPQTGRSIKINGPTFKEFEKTCAQCTEKPIELLGEYYLPDLNGAVPVIKSNGTNYIVRKMGNPIRKVWGPLNKMASNISLCFYKDTWDYRNNHFKPIYIGASEPKRQIIPIKEEKKTVGDSWLNYFLK
jgi:hypothetical protein